MSRLIDVSKLNRAKLIDALVFTMSNEDGARRVRAYYELLSTEQLREVANGVELRVPDLGPRLPKDKPTPTKKHVPLPPMPTRTPRVTDVDKLRAKLQLESWVVDVTNVTNDVLGVVIHEHHRARLQRFIEVYPNVAVLVRTVP